METSTTSGPHDRELHSRPVHARPRLRCVRRGPQAVHTHTNATVGMATGSGLTGQRGDSAKQVAARRHHALLDVWKGLLYVAFILGSYVGRQTKFNRYNRPFAEAGMATSVGSLSRCTGLGARVAMSRSWSSNGSTGTNTDGAIGNVDVEVVCGIAVVS